MVSDPFLDLSVLAAPTAAREARHAVARQRFVGSDQEATLLLLVSEIGRAHV